KNPAQYGLDKMVPEPAVVSDTVTVNYAIDLRLVADVTNASLPEIVALNPSLLRMTTPRDMPFDLHIPVGTDDVFASKIKQIPEDKRDTWRFHVVRDGETLDGIATTFHSHASDITEENGLAASDGVDAGDELVIPIATARAVAHPQTYKVRRGDTLVTVADRFGVTVEQLRRWNHLRSNAVGAGHSLRVSEPVKLAPRMRVRGRSSHGRSRSRKESSSDRSGSKRSSVTSSKLKSSASARTATKNSGANSKNAHPKTKRKAAR
ncbi:MAG: LysM peptidoglycan-binding domain-containing protein, partial [Edaphobacter sp.]